ncbi:hypothetical protein BGX33_006569 [Mortierella sp. NVP41]|nr:hypothetical protein BGX33_006569 [Mortierella sp. NVP41]
MPQLSRTSASLCSLAVALLLIALATNARKDSHLLAHHQQRHSQQQQPDQQPSQQQHHHHEPTLAGALFPVADEILAGKHYVKEPCPTGCVPHRSDVYLAVTSIGEGFPRIQFTCSHPHLSQPTAQPSEGNNHHYNQGPNNNGNSVEPADPIPEHTPQPSSPNVCHTCNQRNPYHRKDSASVYTDLHITAMDHTLQQQQQQQQLNTAGMAFQPHYNFIFSPREIQSAAGDMDDDDTELHTTTMTFTDDKHPLPARPIQMTEEQQQQEPHHRIHIMPARDPSSSGSFKSNVPSNHDGSTTPEPIVTMAAPTSLGGGGSIQGLDDDQQVSRGDSASSADASRKAAALHGHKYKAGPAAPAPEPFPAPIQIQTQISGHTQQQNQYHHHHHHHHQVDYLSSDGGNEKKAGGDAQGGHGNENPVRRLRTIVHRVTTLIIETETIVNRPTLTPTATATARMQGSKNIRPPHRHHNHGQDRYHQQEQQHRRGPHAYGPHAGDHIMFDAGVDGDMIVSIASEQSSRRNKAPAAAAAH